MNKRTQLVLLRGLKELLISKDLLDVNLIEDINKIMTDSDDMLSAIKKQEDDYKTAIQDIKDYEAVIGVTEENGMSTLYLKTQEQILHHQGLLTMADVARQNLMNMYDQYQRS